MKQTILVAVALVTLLGSTQRADAFANAWHRTMTEDALRSEGFSDRTIKLLVIYAQYCDWYEVVDSGVPSWFSWGDEQEAGHSANGFHFDKTSHLESAKAIEREFNLYGNLTVHYVRKNMREGRQQRALAAFGISLHAIQDFYSHSNWVEAAGSRNGWLAYGPGWKEMGLYGSHPTWFDVPAAVRRSHDVYAYGATSHGGGFYEDTDGAYPVPLGTELPPSQEERGPGPWRAHGHYDEDGNESLASGVNKDNSARPYFQDAYITAYIATRQWARAVRSAVADEALWDSFRAADPYDGGDWLLGSWSLDDELYSVFEISMITGAWDGRKEASGSIDAAAASAHAGWYQMSSRGALREPWEDVAIELARDKMEIPTFLRDLGEDFTFHVESSAAIQRDLQFTELVIGSFSAAGGFGFADAPDLWATVQMDGQWMHSSMAPGAYSYDFPAPGVPFTFLKAVSKKRRGRLPISIALGDWDRWSENDRADINRLAGQTDLALWYDKSTGDYIGNVAGHATFWSRGYGKNSLEITGGIRTLGVEAPRYWLPAIL